jgi:hypothetical protein
MYVFINHRYSPRKRLALHKFIDVQEHNGSITAKKEKKNITKVQYQKRVEVGLIFILIYIQIDYSKIANR